MLCDGLALMIVVKHGWDSHLPFSKTGGKSFVAGKCWGLPLEEYKEVVVERETRIEVTGHNKGERGLIWSSLPMMYQKQGLQSDSWLWRTLQTLSVFILRWDANPKWLLI